MVNYKSFIINISYRNYLFGRLAQWCIVVWSRLTKIWIRNWAASGPRRRKDGPRMRSIYRRSQRVWKTALVIIMVGDSSSKLYYNSKQLKQFYIFILIVLLLFQTIKAIFFFSNYASSFLPLKTTAGLLRWFD